MNKSTVLKFGGTSVQDASAITNLVKIVQTRKNDRLIVVSALSKVTDGLVKVADLMHQGDTKQAVHQLSEICTRHKQVGSDLELSTEHINPIEKIFLDLTELITKADLNSSPEQLKDQVLSTGELCSSHLVVGALQKAGVDACWADARDSILTNSQFGSAEVEFPTTNQNIKKNLSPLIGKSVVVTQGFIGKNSNGQTTTLGRGGSDYSAAIFGAGLESEKIEIWTDVDGILSTDPRIVPEAKLIPRIHFSEAAEMAFFGAKVLHPATIFPAMTKRIPVWILNSKNPDCQGTEITFEENPRSTGICGIASKKNVTLVNIYSTRMLGAHGFLKSVFDLFAEHGISVDLISTSEVNVSLTLDPNFNPKALVAVTEKLKQFSQVEVHENRTMISVIGGGIRRTPGIAGKIFSEIADINIQMISMGASELNISFVVDSARSNEAVQRLNRALI